MNLAKKGLKISSAILFLAILAAPSTKAFGVKKSESKVTAEEKFEINEKNVDSNKEECDTQKEEIYTVLTSVSERLSELKELEKSQDEAFVELDKAHKAWAAERYSVGGATYNQYIKANDNSKGISNKINDVKTEINALVSKLSEESSKRSKSLEKYKSLIKTAATDCCDANKSLISKSI